MMAEHRGDTTLLGNELLSHNVLIVFLGGAGTCVHIFYVLGIFEINHQQTMAAGKLNEIGQLAPHSHHTAEIRVQNHQAALGDMTVHRIEQCGEVGFAKRRLLSI